MELQKLIDTIKQYYPKYLSPIIDEEEYYRSKEYKRRREICDRSFYDNGKWNKLLNELGEILCKEPDYNIFDYSHFGFSSPSYMGSFARNRSRIVYSFCISIIIPYFTICKVDHAALDKDTFPVIEDFYPDDEYETYVFDTISNSIAVYYADFERFPPEWYSINLPDINLGDSLTTPVNIFHCAFTTQIV